VKAGRPVLIGLAGPSASGKSTLARRAVVEWERLGCEVVKLDKFYKDAKEFPLVGVWRNWEVPENIKWNELVAALEGLQAGRPVEVPTYSKPLGRQTGVRVAQPAKVVLVEGFLLLAEPQVAQLLDYCVYIRVTPEVQLARRLQRDPALDLEYFKQVVQPAYARHGMQAEQRADVVLDGNQPAEAVWQDFSRVVRVRVTG
jgi:uridine kinase